MDTALRQCRTNALAIVVASMGIDMVAPDTIRAIVRLAVLAPSSHNTQPWRFRVDRDCIDLRADRTRALPVNDPFDRELVISCGAALLTLRAAAAFLGLGTQVAMLPEAGDAD
jgi:nitroreductase